MNKTIKKKENNGPVRVLQYIGCLEAGGSQSMIMNIYRNIDRNIVQFDFIVDRKDNMFYKEEIESLGGRVYVFDEFFKGHNYNSFIRQWRVFFEEHPEYKIIHSHVRSVASIVLKIAKENGLVTICHSHSISNGKGLKAIVKKLLQSRIKYYCDYYFACSMEAAEWLYGPEIANSKKCMIINNAIEIEKYRFNQLYRNRIRKKYLVGNDTFLVGHVGRFEIPKNHRFILELIRSMKDNDVVFMLCGGGSLKSEFERKVKEEGLDDMIILIPETNEIFKYYSAFDCFILPSLYEGLGMVLVEAQFSGLPCLASSNIPKEAMISDAIMFEELSIAKWKERILEERTKKTRNDIHFFDSANEYDVRQTSRRLLHIYLDSIEL